MTARPAGELLREAQRRLAAAGVPSADHDAAELLAHALGVRRGDIALVPDLSQEQRARFEELVTRREAREPLQHLVGTTGFRYAELAVGPGVFVPRPETELLAGWGVGQARTVVAQDRRPTVVDLGTGSGAIARAVADEVPEAEVFAVELSEDALPWAALNLESAGVDLRHGDMASAFEDLEGSVDVVLCNPPYIPLDAFESVAAEARDFDPALALWSGQDGLDAMRVLERAGARLLRPGGVLGAEHADAQGHSAPAVFTGARRWVEVRDHRDLAGRPRYLTARLAR